MLLGLECSLEAAQAALELCKKHSIFTILNPAPAIALDLNFLRGFDLITPNLQEAATLLGLQAQPDIKTLAEHLLQAELCPVVVTLGNQGCLLVESKNALLYPARKVSAADTTGAGDTFNAALAVMLGKGSTLGDAVVYAANAAAYSVRYPHVMESLPTAEKLAEFYEPLVPAKVAHLGPFADRKL